MSSSMTSYKIEVEQCMENREYVSESERRTRVVADVDVIVAGGGTAGIVASLAACRIGAKTLLIEQQGCLGGTLTAGILSSFAVFNDTEKQVIKGIGSEIVDRLRKEGAVIGDMDKDLWIFYDTEAAKYVLDEMAMEEKNLKVFLNTAVVDAVVEDKKIKGLIVESKSGRQAVLANVVIDATGDADVAAAAGAPYVKGRTTDGFTMPASMMARIGDVDTKRLREYYEKHPARIHESKSGFDRRRVPGLMVVGLENELAGPSQRGELSVEMEELRHEFIGFGTTVRSGEVILNVTGPSKVDATNVEDVTRGLMVGRKRLRETVECLRKYVPGFKSCYIVCTASMLGVRETRRIIGEYVLTKEDILSGKSFPDAISKGASFGTVHTPNGKGVLPINLPPGTLYEIPYRCLLPKDIEGLLVAGRCISVTHEALGSVRVSATCMAEGQAAGTAAALAAKRGIAPRNLDISELQRSLIRQGVLLDQL